MKSSSGRRKPAPRRARADEAVAPMRIQKLLSQAGVASRREIERWITEGRVTVNDTTAQLGQAITPEDKVKIDGRLVKRPLTVREPLRILCYHKPEGEICTRNDPEQRVTVFEKMPKLATGRWVLVGRLDINSSGLLLFTNSGALANLLMHPSQELLRVYAVRVLGQLSEQAEQELKNGVSLEDGMARFTFIRPAGGEGANHWYHVGLQEGRNREVRRMFETQGVVVNRLIRIQYGPFNLPRGLKRGHHYDLRPDEVAEICKSVNYKPE